MRIADSGSRSVTRPRHSRRGDVRDNRASRCKPEKGEEFSINGYTMGKVELYGYLGELRDDEHITGVGPAARRRRCAAQAIGSSAKTLQIEAFEEDGGDFEAAGRRRLRASGPSRVAGPTRGLRGIDLALRSRQRSTVPGRCERTRKTAEKSMHVATRDAQIPSRRDRALDRRANAVDHRFKRHARLPVMTRRLFRQPWHVNESRAHARILRRDKMRQREKHLVAHERARAVRQRGRNAERAQPRQHRFDRQRRKIRGRRICDDRLVDRLRGRRYRQCARRSGWPRRVRTKARCARRPGRVANARASGDASRSSASSIGNVEEKATGRTAATCDGR